MLTTYRAVLRGHILEWLNDKPEQIARDKAVNVHVTILEEETPPLSTIEQGQKMATVLEQLAQTQSSLSSLDPLVWEREMRDERELPGSADSGPCWR